MVAVLSAQAMATDSLALRAETEIPALCMFTTTPETVPFVFGDDVDPTDDFAFAVHANSGQARFTINYTGTNIQGKGGSSITLGRDVGFRYDTTKAIVEEGGSFALMPGPYGGASHIGRLWASTKYGANTYAANANAFLEGTITLTCE